jgi:hypothetical protein
MHAAFYQAFANNKKLQERDKASTTDKSPHSLVRHNDSGAGAL